MKASEIADPKHDTTAFISWMHQRRSRKRWPSLFWKCRWLWQRQRHLLAGERPRRGKCCRCFCCLQKNISWPARGGRCRRAAGECASWRCGGSWRYCGRTIWSRQSRSLLGGSADFRSCSPCRREDCPKYGSSQVRFCRELHLFHLQTVNTTAVNAICTIPKDTYTLQEIGKKKNYICETPCMHSRLGGQLH